ncbi:MAG: hypothetical protein FD167_1054, partial [bacterium]
MSNKNHNPTRTKNIYYLSTTKDTHYFSIDKNSHKVSHCLLASQISRKLNHLVRTTGSDTRWAARSDATLTLKTNRLEK